MTTIAHLTDVHLGPIEGFAPRYWNLKRGLGYANWVRKRRHVHQRGVLDRIVADMEAQQPDHIAVTGDLANIGLPREHINALAWLKGVGPPERVTVVPGNHDTYSRIGRDPGARRWAEYMSSNAEGLAYAGSDASRFPFVRVIGEVALIGVDSAVETPPLMAWGRIGKRQLDALAGVLERLQGSGLFRLVLVHHPPLRGQADASRGLRDAPALEAVLERGGAELAIHGHNHRNMLGWLPCSAGPDAGHDTAPGRVAVVGAPSASRGRSHRHEALGRYNLYRIERTGSGGAQPWRIELVGRGLAEPDGPVVELDRRELSLGDGAPSCPQEPRG
jgi:3',5'-cyclic AMP phosphodiesterase CpdA